MPRIPGEPEPDALSTLDTASSPPASTDSRDPIDVPEEDVRATATSLGLDYDTLNGEEQQFVANFHAGLLDALPASSPEDNPLIPTPAPDDADASGATTTDASSTGAGESEGGGDAVSGAEPGEVGGTTTTLDGAPQAPVPPAPPVPPIPPAPSNETVAIPGVGDVPVAVLAQAMGIAQSLSQEDLDLIASVRAGQVQLPGQPVPAGQQVAPVAPALTPEEEWDDPRAQAAFAQVNQQLQQLTAQQQQILTAQIEEQAQALERIASDATETFATTYGLDDETTLRLATLAHESGLIRAMAPAHPGDPHSAMTKALEAAYWTDPTTRALAIQGQVNATLEANRTAEEKKAAQMGIAATGGTASRTRQAPKDDRDRLNQMADVIAQSPEWAGTPNGNGAG